MRGNLQPRVRAQIAWLCITRSNPSHQQDLPVLTGPVSHSAVTGPCQMPGRLALHHTGYPLRSARCTSAHWPDRPMGSDRSYCYMKIIWGSQMLLEITDLLHNKILSSCRRANGQVGMLTHAHAVCKARDGLLQALGLVQRLHVAAQHGLAHLHLALDDALQQRVQRDPLQRDQGGSSKVTRIDGNLLPQDAL